MGIFGITRSRALQQDLQGVSCYFTNRNNVDVRVDIRSLDLGETCDWMMINKGMIDLVYTIN